MSRPSRKEILVRVEKVINNTTNHKGEVDEDTTFEGWEVDCPNRFNRNVFALVIFEVAKEFRDNPSAWWIFPNSLMRDSCENWNYVKDIVDAVESGYDFAEKEVEEEENNKKKLIKVKEKLKDVRLVDFDEFIHGNPSWEIIQKFFLEGEFDEENYLVEAIEKHLQTEEQRQLLFDKHLDILKILNGRYGEKDGEEDLVDKIFNEWDEKLGWHKYGD